MKNLLLLLLTITTLKAAGQNHIIGVKGGATWTNVASSNFLKETDDRTGVTAGLTYEYLLNKYFSVGADLIYSQKGFTSDLLFANQAWPGGLQSETIQFSYDYLSLPVKAGFNVGNKLYGFMNIGVVPSLLVNARTIRPLINANGEKTGSSVFNATSVARKFDFAGLAEIGGGYKIKNRFWVFASFTFESSFTTITNSDYFPGSKIKNYGMALALGLKCPLAKGNPGSSPERQSHK
jgi:hypothetical protein